MVMEEDTPKLQRCTLMCLEIKHHDVYNQLSDNQGNTHTHTDHTYTHMKKHDKMFTAKSRCREEHRGTLYVHFPVI